jgi:hypothetical protein
VGVVVQEEEIEIEIEIQPLFWRMGIWLRFEPGLLFSFSSQEIRDETWGSGVVL